MQIMNAEFCGRIGSLDIFKKIVSAVAGALILVVGVGILMYLGGTGEREPIVTPAVKENAAVEQGAAAVSTAILHEEPQTPALVKVARVIDGDTIEVEIDGKVEPVRYIGIDTPETVDPRKSVQCFGVEASKKNKELVEGKMVRLEKDITDRDKYNRLLRYVYVEPQMNPSSTAELTTGHGADRQKTQINADRFGAILVNLTLVVQGFARAASYPPDITYKNQFVAAERAARDAKRGLWSACPKEAAP